VGADEAADRLGVWQWIGRLNNGHTKV